MENKVTIEFLREVFPEIDGLRLKLAMKIINGEITSEELESFESNEQWIKQCYNRPSDNELAMNALNEVLEGFGVEPIRIEGEYINHYYRDIVASYINMGDSYNTTIVFDHSKQSYSITTWADYVELLEMKEDNFS